MQPGLICIGSLSTAILFVVLAKWWQLLSISWYNSIHIFMWQPSGQNKHLSRSGHQTSSPPGGFSFPHFSPGPEDADLNITQPDIILLPQTFCYCTVLLGVWLLKCTKGRVASLGKSTVRNFDVWNRAMPSENYLQSLSITASGLFFRTNTSCTLNVSWASCVTGHSCTSAACSVFHPIALPPHSTLPKKEHHIS